jgi:alanyl-tRNA synthetase
MNQFKDVFTGSRKVSYNRAVTSQKCIRAGGKHNDLENVGQTLRHHTFFEMLGNFSFGDYFKEEAIAFAWEWFTKTLGLPVDKLYATVYTEDDDAFALWKKIAPELKNGRILRFGMKDNFWSMGDVGPCGPCTEIHIDRGEHLSIGQPDAGINTENERFVELGNLVFMQYDQTPDGKMVPLPKPSVDTGSGFERIAAAMQNVDSNYETDLFAPLTAMVAEITGIKYDTGPAGTSHRVLADHVRSLSFALADGGGLSNEGRGYVLRRILRRGARHGRLLGYHEPIICKLVPTLIEGMGYFFPELKEKQNHIEAVVKSEEERFGELLDTGLDLFSNLEKKVKASGSDTIPGEDIFKLYDTYGFPVDMTAIMAGEAGLKMDMDGFNKSMERQQEQSRAGSGFGNQAERRLKRLLDALTKIDESVESTVFTGHKHPQAFEIVTQIKHRAKDPDNPDRVAVLLVETPFYAESGGQVNDIGIIESEELRIEVEKVSKYHDLYIHEGKLTRGSSEDPWVPRKSVTARIDETRRRDIMRNHTATHLLHAALRQVVGDHVKQSGSLVEASYFRFDFAHFKALTPDEIEEIEKIVNEQILKATNVTTDLMPVEEAMSSGAMALFDEKYGDEVRVVSIADFSKELCGGTHVTNTAEIGSFLITDESAIASGIRRIEGVTGRGAAELSRANKISVGKVGAILNVPGNQVVPAVERVTSDMAALQKEIKKLRAERFSGGGATVGESENLGDLECFYHDFGETDQESMSGWTDSKKGAQTQAVAVGVGILNGKRTFMATASASAIEAGFDTGKLFGQLVRELGGRGGGKANFARGGLPDDIVFDDFVNKVKEKIKESQE